VFQFRHSQNTSDVWIEKVMLFQSRNKQESPLADNPPQAQSPVWIHYFDSLSFSWYSLNWPCPPKDRWPACRFQQWLNVHFFKSQRFPLVYLRRLAAGRKLNKHQRIYFWFRIFKSFMKFAPFLQRCLITSSFVVSAAPLFMRFRRFSLLNNIFESRIKRNPFLIISSL